ncbi:THAP domain-containing protein 5-like isoform X1 [Xenia sp. Carnegie-2017]|uniref:THAP domain-containing protein 5-like isoform X1 n=1 Tax=Xenia sp. Carnegie-2017 TaxID=2897299 RepID=UPI001F0398BF|nr:THAP domain-containing protein 5-like isoform X1 [Xenia sp. Carnegie-2017]
MPDRCVVFGCSNVASSEKGISLHRIPFFNDERSEAKRRRKRWVNFVKATRDKLVPTKNSAVCSEHFTKDSLSRQFGSLSESESNFAPRLIQDEFGIVAYPSIYPRKDDNELTTRDRRMMKRMWMSDYKREVESENILSTSSEPQEQIEEITCDEPVLSE